MVNEADVRLFADKCKAIFEQVGRDIIGQEDIVELTVIAMIAGGNVLLEGVPGLAKTLAISTLSKLVDADFNRIQFTPDLLPADVFPALLPDSVHAGSHARRHHRHQRAGEG